MPGSIGRARCSVKVVFCKSLIESIALDAGTSEDEGGKGLSLSLDAFQVGMSS